MIPLNRIVFAAALGFLSPVFVRYCFAQEAPKPAAPPSQLIDLGDPIIRVVALKHADAHSVVTTLKQLNMPLESSVTGPQTIVLRGYPPEVQKVIDTLIAAVDVPGVTGGSSRSAEIIPVRHYPIQQIGELAHNVAPKSSLGIDESRRTIVVNGTDDEKRAVRELLKEIDRPTRSAKIHFFFLRGSIGSAASEKEMPLPADLLPVGKSLAQNGFGRLTLIAPIVIGVEEGQRFESNSRLHLGEDTAGHDDLQFNVQGVARLASGADDAWLTLRGRMAGKYSRIKDADMETVFELDTAVATKLGHYVILAAAPSSTAAGDAVALVVRLTAE